MPDPMSAPRPRPRSRHRHRHLLILAGLLTIALITLAPRTRQAIIDRRLDRHMPLIRQHAAASNLPPDLVRAVVHAESGGRRTARSDRGALGLMQITPIAEKDVLQRHRHIPPGDLLDPSYNLRIGTIYLADQLERFDHNLPLALAAYHMGPTAVARGRREHRDLDTGALLNRIAGPRTRAYIRTVLNHLDNPAP